MTWRFARRAALCTLTAAVALASAASALVNADRATAPEAALAIAPRDGQALMIRDDRALAVAGTLLAADEAGVVADARVALLSGPLNPAALRMLGLVAGNRGDQRKAVALIVAANKMSRRDLGAQTWLIEYNVQRGDIGQALDHYDIALSTKAMSANLLLPVLTGALTEPDIRRALAPYLAADRPWERAFLNYAIPRAGNPQDLAAAILMGGGLPRDPDYRVFETRLLWALMSRGQFGMARTYLNRMIGFEPAVLDDHRFVAAMANPYFGPFSWTLASSAEATAQIEAPGRLWVQVSPGTTEIVAQRSMLLSPGTYRLSYAAGAPVDTVAAQSGWELRCLVDGGWRMAWQAPTPRLGPVRLDFSIPAGCPAQTLVLKASAVSPQSAAELYLQRFSLTAQ